MNSKSSKLYADKIVHLENIELYVCHSNGKLAYCTNLPRYVFIRCAGILNSELQKLHSNNPIDVLLMQFVYKCFDNDC